MNMLRICLLGTAVVAVLLGPTGAALTAAEDETVPSGPAIVTGYMYAPSGGGVGVYEFEDDWIVQHSEESGDLQMDDPRLDGKLDLVETKHEMRGSGHKVLSGTATVTNDLGSWVGTSRGYSPLPGLKEWLVELTGEDGNEGLSAMLFFREDPDHTGASLVSGIVFVGPQPPLPEPTSD